MRIHIILSMVAPLVFLAGCSDDDPGGSGDSGQACNDIADTIAKIEVQQKAEKAPEAMGGTLEEGLYVATAYTQYTGTGGATGPNGESHRAAMRLSGITFDMGQKGSFEWLHDDYRTAGTFRTNGGSSFTENATCPPPEPGVGYIVPEYTASENAILYYLNPNQVVTLTRQ